MDHRLFVFVVVMISLLSGCASKRQSSQAVESGEASEENTGAESSSRYRKLQGSSGFSSEEADEQLEGY